MNKKGFTLLELLVVVLIIGILASSALPQYQMAVTKAKVASILPLMRRFKDALAEYKLQHGSYLTEDGDYPDADTLGVNWPTDWECYDNFATDCHNDYWSCYVNSDESGFVGCGNRYFHIMMYQVDDPTYEALRGVRTCESLGEEGEKVCKALGGKLLEGVEGYYSDTVYKLN